MLNNLYDTERLLLGCFMLINDCSGTTAQKALKMLKPKMFAEPAHQVLFENIRKMVNSNLSVDFMALADMCDKDNSFKFDGMAYVGEIYRNTTSGANIVNYAAMIRKNAQKRFAVNKLHETLANLSDSDDSQLESIIGGLNTFTDELLSKSSSDNGIRHISEMTDGFLEAADNRINNPEKFAGYNTGISQLDDLLGFKKLRKGTLMVIGARPKMGKSMFLTKITNHFALTEKKATLVYSMEMLNEEVIERTITDDSGVGSEIFYRGAKSDNDWARVGKTISELNSSNMYINDTSGITLEQIKREARNIHKKHEVGIIAVDYLTLMTAEKAERNDLSYGIITKGLKALAKELKCVVLMLTQLNRNLESRMDKRPMPSDSRDTGQIEQDCDYWLGLYRESVYNDKVSDNQKGYTELGLRLNRHGNTGTSYLNMDGGRFIELDKEKYALMDHAINLQSVAKKGGYDGVNN